MSKNILGKDEETFKASEEKKYSQTRKRYMIMFKENRSFELYVGRGYYRFGPYEQLEVDEDFINHPDFIQQQKSFAVREL
jgi:hypothetical protein